MCRPTHGLLPFEKPSLKHFILTRQQRWEQPPLWMPQPIADQAPALPHISPCPASPLRWSRTRRRHTPVQPQPDWAGLVLKIAIVPPATPNNLTISLSPAGINTGNHGSYHSAPWGVWGAVSKLQLFSKTTNPANQIRGGAPDSPSSQNHRLDSRISLDSLHCSESQLTLPSDTNVEPGRRCEPALGVTNADLISPHPLRCASPLHSAIRSCSLRCAARPAPFVPNAHAGGGALGLLKKDNPSPHTRS